ncbi:hypothetical protein J6590_101039 [Homalodisca vitripennis]|nr:hypothetical protein J6590_101039 [Homalodisca vitripennis]
MSEISERSTRRGTSLLSIPIHRTTTFSKLFTVSACRLWNALPINIRAIDKRARFGAEVRVLMLGLRGQAVINAVLLLCRSTDAKEFDDDFYPRFGGNVINRIQQLVSPSYFDTIECSLLFGANNSCERLFQVLITAEGVCFSFNLLPNRTLFSPTTGNALKAFAPKWYGPLSNALVLCAATDISPLDLESHPLQRHLYSSAVSPPSQPLKLTPQKDTYYSSVRVQYAQEFNNSKPPIWSLEKGYVGGAGITRQPIRAVGTGLKRGVAFVLKTNMSELDYECRRTQGFRVSLTNPAEIPADNSFYYLPTSGLTLMAIEPKVMDTSEGLRFYSPYKRYCFFPSERRLTYFSTYTQSNCELECLTNFTLRSCNCVEFYMPRNETTLVCDIGSTSCVFNAEVMSRTVDRDIRNGLVVSYAYFPYNSEAIPPTSLLRRLIESVHSTELLKKAHASGQQHVQYMYPQDSVNEPSKGQTML